MDLSALIVDVTDPSDFPTDSLRKLDSSLRCTICKDFYDGPVVLHCGHTFCSLCIRSILPNKRECPICRVTAKETHLVRNSMIGEAVNAWSDVRASVLKLSNESLRPPSARSFSPNNRKRRRSHGSSDPSPEAGPSKLRYNNKKRFGSDDENMYGRIERPERTCRLSSEDIIPSSDPEEEELPNPGITNAVVACPLCSRNVPYNAINPHMDSNCKKFVAGGDSPATSRLDSKAAWGSIFKGQAKKAATVLSAQDLEIPTTRIAKVSYGLLTLSALRKLLAENGLPTSGDKDELITRHERWIAIYNANLDRGQPKPVGDLREQLKEREDTGNRPGPKKVVDEKAWAQKNSAQFASLIAAARPKPKAAEGSRSSQTTDLRSSPLEKEKDVGTSSNAIVID
ncbi:hypothetical protein JB92DRAFT_2945591 [Gautieria morchelliformis]|nr:hypothetical protein JB92DRAFT_2945591 [Gautieria morchelliformis]